MEKRGYKHNTPLDEKLATGKEIQDFLIDSIEEQKQILKNKKCKCKI